MTHPDDELLAAVALDEELDPAVHDHLRSCAQCSTVVDELRSVLGAVRADAPLIAPPDPVWDAIREAVGHDAPSVGSDGGAAAAPVQPRPQGGVSRRAAFGLVAAAASGLALGAGGVWLATRPEEPPTVSPLASVPLETLDTGEVLGEAYLLRSPQGLGLTVRTQPLDPRDGYLEVWLINRDLARMVSVGVMPPGSTELTFPVAPALIDQGYVVVDISREAFDDRPQHSGDSVVRGELQL